MPGLLILALIAGFVDGSFGVLPKEYHKVHRKLIWGIMAAGIVNVLLGILSLAQPGMAALLGLLALLSYFVFRGVGFLGLAYSFRAYSRDESAPISPTGVLLAWAASTVDVLAVAAVMVEALIVGVMSGPSLAGNPAAAARIGKVEAHFYVALGIGLVITILFLISMNASKNRVFAFRRAELKTKNEERLRALKLKKQAAAQRPEQGPS
jgi:hypothetical protein